MGDIISCVVCFGCAALFYGLGIYAQRREEPMWFYSGSKVEASEITDILQYNHENGVMWKRYSLWYWAAGIATFWDPLAMAVLMCLSCTVGMVILVRTYHKILKKYKKT